jgi:hypothetical protein
MLRDLQILEQLYRGNHLDNDEIERAYHLVTQMKVQLNMRIKNGN